jgi:hypothetical protein
MAKQAASFRNEFDELAREIDHPGESGTAREHALRELLRRYLPRRVEVDTGFVIDATGGQSRQVDLVLYDRDSATVWDVNRVKYFPCETVIAVGEVKTRIKTTRTLIDALNAVRSVKALDRSNRGTNLPITGPGYSMTPPFTFDPTQPRDQILGFVFTDDSMIEETLMTSLRGWMAKEPRLVWPNIYCDFNRFLVSYEDPQHLTTSAMGANGMYVTAPDEKENLLLLFVTLLSSFVNEAHIARPSLFDYAGIGATMHRDYPLTP